MLPILCRRERASGGSMPLFMGKVCVRQKRFLVEMNLVEAVTIASSIGCHDKWATDIPFFRPGS